MLDYYFEAIRFWQGSNKNLKRFAECCANVDGKRTAALAEDCKVSVDVIENHRNAYKLFYEMFSKYETSDIERIWNEANISLWIAAAKRRKKHDIETLKEYMQTATENNMTVEQLRVELDSRSATQPEWIGRLKNLVKMLFKLRTDWKTEIPSTKREEFESWLLGFERWVKELAEEE